MNFLPVFAVEVDEEHNPQHQPNAQVLPLSAPDLRLMADSEVMQSVLMGRAKSRVECVWIRNQRQGGGRPRLSQIGSVLCIMDRSFKASGSRRCIQLVVSLLQKTAVSIDFF
ncbi:hypothetical protein PVAP13_1NG123319 [Panicum virgatum]|uniref:Uncharacterized protein n=1 Tax=Panicum virgatum TaxID=38727 RepID=A0A8T0WQR1_PANVG|nr:hypothetical protein PVAP13_1NG123319 [Panicum virgatum]